VNGDILRNAIRFWEPRRIWYNAALAALTIAWVVLTWPHFRPVFTLTSLAKLIVLALLANVCYSAAYLVDLPMQLSAFRVGWQRWRWVMWSLGTLFALLFTYYWIADEIYPYVSAA
jgi:hypothetical protein